MRSAGFKIKNEYVVDTEAGMKEQFSSRNNEDQGTRTPQQSLSLAIAHTNTVSHRLNSAYWRRSSVFS